MSNANPKTGPQERWHRRMLEGRLGVFAIAVTVVISIGGIVEITPMFSARLGPQPLAGGTLYFLGVVMMAWNFILTARGPGRKPAVEPAPAPQPALA